MVDFPLTPAQRAVIERPAAGSLFLAGPAGSGKTTTGVASLVHWLERGVRADGVMVLTPQRTLAEPYLAALRTSTSQAGGLVSVVTLGGLARRMVDLFWPLVAEEAGFACPEKPPVFLTLETAQYYMARLVRPLLDQGYFETITIDRNRLYSQILDNLNKAAGVGFPYTDIGPRLKSAWVGESAQRRVYDEVQSCAEAFRAYCLEHNLLDFSLQLELFLKLLWPVPICRDYLLSRYRYWISDNLEEDIPATHDFLAGVVPEVDAALLIYDTEAGYRRFLGADPESAEALRESCKEQVIFMESFVTEPALQKLGRRLGRALHREGVPPESMVEEKPAGAVAADAEPPPVEFPSDEETQAVRETLIFEYHRYYPQMLDWVTAEIAALVRDQGVAPGEIVVLAPFLSDSLRFSLSERLTAAGVPVRSHRPSRSLRDEPATQCLLTLAAIAHPAWGVRPNRFDVVYAFLQAIGGLDLVRAQLLAEIVYRIKEGLPTLTPFDALNAEAQERITFRLGNRYERLRSWLYDYRDEVTEVGAPEFDHFLSRLFGEVLSQPEFGFHNDFDAGGIAANLIESVQKFRWVLGDDLPADRPLGQEYLEMVQDGVVAAQYIRSWQQENDDAVLLAPAYTFLMRNKPVDYQFWLDIGSSGWWERLFQPVTHPYVLSRAWTGERPWNDTDEYEVRQETLYRLSLGLVRRCRRAIYLGLSELGEQGFEQQGPLLRAFQNVLKK